MTVSDKLPTPKSNGSLEPDWDKVEPKAKRWERTNVMVIRNGNRITFRDCTTGIVTDAVYRFGSVRQRVEITAQLEDKSSYMVEYSYDDSVLLEVDANTKKEK